MDIEVSLVDDNPETVEDALYFQIDHGWITFKDDQGKAVTAYPESRVTRIKRVDNESRTEGRENVIHVQASLDGARIATEVARRLDGTAA